MAIERGFDPRRAALFHAGLAERDVERRGRWSVVAHTANAVACGLVYVGDQIGRLVDARSAAGEEDGMVRVGGRDA